MKAEGPIASTPKTEARTFYRALREAIPPEMRTAADAAIAAQVKAMREFAQADVLFTYLSVDAEVDTREIICTAWEAGKVVAVPRCVPKTNLMRWHRITDFDSLERSSFGIEEPPDDAASLIDVPAPGLGTQAIALVPGLSFDANGYRIGYGGGFYDVFLPSFGGTAIGLCRALQLSENPLPRDAHDVAVDVVVSESRIMRPRSPQERSLA